MAQKADVIMGPKIPAGVYAELIEADSHVLMVSLQGRKKHKIASYSLPGFEPIEEYTLDLPKGTYFSHFVKTGGTAVGIAIRPDEIDNARIKIMIKQFIPGKFAASKWIDLYDGLVSKERKPHYLPLSFADQPDPELMKKPYTYFHGYKVFWAEKENALYTCVLISNPISGTAVHVVKINLSDESMEVRDIHLSDEPRQVYLNHFAVQNDHFIVETSVVTKTAPPGSIDELYVINKGTLEVIPISINSFLPENRKISSNTVFVNSGETTFSAVGIIEASDNSGSHYTGLFRLVFDLVNGKVDTCRIEPLPYEYFESSRNQPRRQVYIDQSWSNPDGSVHLACYSYFTGVASLTRYDPRATSPSTQYSSYKLEADRSRELVLIDLDSNYSLVHHQMFQRNAFHDRSSNKKVLAYTHTDGRNLLMTDLKEHFDQGQRLEQVPERGYSVHTTLAIGSQNNQGKWVFSELKINSNDTFYPSGFIQYGPDQFVAIAVPSVSKNRICLIRIIE